MLVMQRYDKFLSETMKMLSKSLNNLLTRSHSQLLIVHF